ncbi:MAG: AAA family ATPase [Dysgonamonadaceae bacterium]|jgi:hypothetical protein|nr:AAA family ATPase [Dysgonamonadaceae bacterium]
MKNETKKTDKTILDEMETTQQSVAEQQNEMKRRLDTLLQKCKVDLSTSEIEPTPLLAIGGIPVFTLGNISAIGGKAKSGKTFLVSYLCGEMLQSNPDIKILIFDTEQGGFHVQKCVRRVHRLMGWSEHENNDRLVVCKLREYSTSERLQMVGELIYHINPDFVFLDGVKDLVQSINSEAEATSICDYLLKWSTRKNCHICSVLHQNKSTGDSNLRGHIGTELTNKSETVISVTPSSGVVKVSPTNPRNEPFNDFYFKINDDGLPEKCEPPKKQEASGKTKPSKKTTSFDEILTANKTGMTWTALCKEIAKIDGVTEKAAQGRISRASKNGIIRQCESGLYYSSSTDDVEDENEGRSVEDDTEFS